MQSIFRLFLLTVITLLNLHPLFVAAIPVPEPAPESAAETSQEITPRGTSAGAVYEDHWFGGKAHNLELGCNFLTGSGLAQRVSSYRVNSGYICDFYENEHCFGGALWRAEDRDDATVWGHHNDRVGSVACGPSY